MSIYAILAFEKQGSRLKLIQSAWDVSDFSFFIRSTAKKAMIAASEISIGLAKTTTLSRLSADRVPQLEELPVSGLSVFLHQQNNTTIALVIGDEYPNNTAYQCSKEAWTCLLAPAPEKALQQLLVKAQDYREYDKIASTNQRLKETKEQMIQNLESLLERGDRIEDLVAKTDILSESSEAFLKKSKDMNRCCPGLWVPW